MKCKTLLLVAGICAGMLLNSGCSNIPAEGKEGKAIKSEKKAYFLKPNDDLKSFFSKVSDGESLVLKEGTYDIKDTLVLDGKKNVSVKGEGEVWVNIVGIDHHVITIKNSSNILLQNIKAQHFMTDEEKAGKKPVKDSRNGSVVGVMDSKSVELINCELIGCGIYGIYGEYTEKITLDKCYLHHNSLKAMAFMNNKSKTEVILRDCKIMNNADVLDIRGNVQLIKEGTNTIINNDEKSYKQSPR